MNTQFFELYSVDGVVYGTPLRAVTTYQLRLEYDHCFDLRGQTAIFFLVTREDTIGRENAIAFASAVAAGKVVYHHIDLSQIGTIRKAKKK